MTVEDIINKISLGKINIYINYWYNYQGYIVKKDTITQINKLDVYSYNSIQSCEILEIKVKLEHDEDTYLDESIVEILIQE